jgi:hypothetical protein
MQFWSKALHDAARDTLAGRNGTPTYQFQRLNSWARRLNSEPPGSVRG